MSFASGTSIEGLNVKKLCGRNETVRFSTGILNSASALISNTKLVNLTQGSPRDEGYASRLHVKTGMNVRTGDVAF